MINQLINWWMDWWVGWQAHCGMWVCCAHFVFSRYTLDGIQREWEEVTFDRWQTFVNWVNKYKFFVLRMSNTRQWRWTIAHAIRRYIFEGTTCQGAHELTKLCSLNMVGLFIMQNGAQKLDQKFYRFSFCCIPANFSLAPQQHAAATVLRHGEWRDRRSKHTTTTSNRVSLLPHIERR